MAKCPHSMLLYLTTRCDQKCRHCLVRNSYPGDANRQLSMEVIQEFAELGGVYIDLTGGNPALVNWLPDILQLCNSLGLYSSLTLSGPALLRARDYLELPTILRISIDGCSSTHDSNRGHGSYAQVLSGLEVVRSKRTGMKTQLIFTAIPGKYGNITQEDLYAALRLTRNYRLLLNVNPVFGGTTQISPKELAMLSWLGRQADVQMSRGKIRFVSQGGNNINHPSCSAIHDTITVAPNGRIVLPCFHHQIEDLDLRYGLEKTLSSPTRIGLLRQEGSFAFCKGCTIWCYIVPSMIHHICDRAFVWMHGLSGLQRCRDSVLRTLGLIRLRRAYPDFQPPNS